VTIPARIRVDKGSENYEICAVQTVLHRFQQHIINPYSNQEVRAYTVGRSVHNQKIESFWSRFIIQWEERWRRIFHSLEWEEIWQPNRTCDKAALLFVFMPILRAELEWYRVEYNAYPIRKNQLSRLPSGPPEDIYLLSPADLNCDTTVSRA
jgi:hypothetical protein